MNITFTIEDLKRLSEPARLEVAELFLTGVVASALSAATSADDLFARVDMRNVVDLTMADVARFMAGLHPKTVAGLWLFAKHGPIVDLKSLAEIVHDPFHFKGRLSRRVGTITGMKGMRLLGVEHWWVEDGRRTISGRFAVSRRTHASLRAHFDLPPSRKPEFYD